MKTIKKLVSCLLVLCIIAAVLPMNVHAASASGSCGKNVTWKVSNDGVLTISGTGAMWDYDFENEECAPWFENYSEDITKIVISKGVTTIGDYAFCLLYNVTSLSIPTTVTSIGEFAFADCVSLETLTIPSSVTAIEDGAFYGCMSLLDLTVPGTISTIGDGAFGFCFSLDSVILEEGVRTIGEAAFSDCWCLAKVVIPASVTTIEDAAFSGAMLLENVYFLGNAPSIASDAFVDAYATAYYPAGNSTWTAAKRASYGGELEWVSYAKGEKPWEQETEDEIFLLEPDLEAANVTSTGKIKLTWCEIDGADSYKVYRSTSEDGPYTLLKTTTGTSLTHAPAAGSTYYYYVKAVSIDGVTSEASNIVSCTAKLAQPVITLSNVASTGKNKISWNAVEGAVKYKVYCSTSKNGTYTALKTTTGTSFTHTSAVAGQTYYYKVIALAEKTAANSAFSAVKSLTCDLAQPKVTLGNVQSSGKIKVMWNAVEGAVKYKVYYSTSENGTYTALKTTTGTSLTHASTEAGKTYYYKVIALAENSAANSAFSAIKSLTCDLARPTVKVALNASGKPVLTWNAVEGAVKYKLYICDADGNQLKTATTTSTKATHSTAVSGETYRYQLVAMSSVSGAHSAKSVAVSIQSK